MNDILDKLSNPSATDLKEKLIGLRTPTVFDNILESWENVPFSLHEMIETYGNTPLEFRSVPKTFKSIAWEGDAMYVKATISQFGEWLKQDKMPSYSMNPLCSYNRDEYWLYSSYNYLNVIFPKDSNILKAVNWHMFGLSEDIGTQSAFWIGSEGSYTPCHYDSYGCNLVAQICGRKKWILFPPEDATSLYPTRIPYEESSIFSAVNILKPDLSTHPLFKNSHPHVVILEPGQVLFVPKHWWHFVESLETSISINTWIKLDSDRDTQIEEAITKTLMTSLINSFEPEGKTWLNPNEELVSPQESLQYIIALLANGAENQKADDTPITHKDEELRKKKVLKTIAKSDVFSDFDSQKDLCSKTDKNVSKVEIDFNACFSQQNCTETNTSAKILTVENIVNCFVHPEVVSLISQKLKLI